MARAVYQDIWTICVTTECSLIAYSRGTIFPTVETITQHLLVLLNGVSVLMELTAYSSTIPKFSLYLTIPSGWSRESGHHKVLLSSPRHFLSSYFEVSAKLSNTYSDVTINYSNFFGWHTFLNLTSSLRNNLFLTGIYRNNHFLSGAYIYSQEILIKLFQR